MSEIGEIKERNRRVEMDKAWEVSFTRRVLIALVTYIVATIWLSVIGVRNPFLNAFVPTLGYILSTLSLPFIKKWWIKNQK